MKARLLALLLVLTACGGTPEPPPPSPSPSAPPCPEGGVEFGTVGGEAAMGLRVLTLEMRNCGTGEYRVSGYPDLRLLDEDGTPLDVVVEHGSTGVSRIESFEQPPTELVLAPGDHATAGIVWRNTYHDTTNPPQVGARIDIAPLEGRPRQTFTPRLGTDGGPPQSSSPATTIDLGSTGRIGVSPWQPPRN
ncbi:DUF4232 domain-containing protein [Saccharothrix obliqua]|uniref:DUF4232 domain-containing protein n=1 Tax=Saccharothrix obliqua TaxID=2861747 RepID=UPI001C5F274F|nr:DUF4232 domain-containing protein [Saccharothrix obliqua]MBW4721945.1 DUF4232 domain-containing protein [Saccharothrix obliqua]